MAPLSETTRHLRAKSADIARRAWRVAYWLPRDLLYLFRSRFPQYLLYYGGDAYGDYLLLGTVAEELRRRGATRIAVLTKRPTLFLNWPPEIRFFHEEWRLLSSVRLCGTRVSQPKYYLQEHPPEYDVPSRSHIIAEMCRVAGMRGNVSLRTYFHLTAAERERGRLVKDQAVIQCTSTSVAPRSPLKHWDVVGYQKVVDQLNGRLNFVQLGSEREPLLEGVLDLRGKTSVREAAAVIAASRVNVGYVGFLMHLARAVEVRSVVIFGGREHPDQSGYICNENLFTKLSCSPCWRLSTCDYGMPCMQRISSESVVMAVERVLSKGGEPLELETAWIPSLGEEFELPWLQPGFSPPQ